MAFEDADKPQTKLVGLARESNETEPSRHEDPILDEDIILVGEHPERPRARARLLLAPALIVALVGAANPVVRWGQSCRRVATS